MFSLKKTLCTSVVLSALTNGAIAQNLKFEDLLQNKNTFVRLRISTNHELNTYVRARANPSTSASILANLMEHDFELDQAYASRADGAQWHRIKLSQNPGDVGYVANVENVFLIRGVISLPKAYKASLRNAPSINAPYFGTTSAGETFEVLDVVKSSDGLKWYKVLVRDVDTERFAFILDKDQNGQSIRLVTDAKQIRVLMNEKSNATALPSCGQGSAHMAYVKTFQTVFPSAKVSNAGFFFQGRNRAVILPRGTRVKAMTYGNKAIVENGYLKIELIEQTSTGLRKIPAFIKRSEVSISGECQDYGPDIVAARGLQHWNGSEYRSNSASPRATNVALSLTRVDGQTIKSNEEFSFLERAVFPSELKTLNYQTSDLDQMGCPPGYMFNKMEPNRLQGYCRAFLHGTSTSLQPIYAGGICGTSTLIHRAVFATGLPITRMHNHGMYYPGSYGLSDDVYGRLGGVGTEAEVAWDTLRSGGRDWSGYRFINDSRSSLTAVTSTWYSQEDNVTHGILQFYGYGQPDRVVQVNKAIPAFQFIWDLAIEEAKQYPVNQVISKDGLILKVVSNQDNGIGGMAVTAQDENRFKWSRAISYLKSPVRRVVADLPNISTVFENGVRVDTVKTHYNCRKVLDKDGKDVINPKTKKATIDCSMARSFNGF